MISFPRAKSSWIELSLPRLPWVATAQYCVSGLLADPEHFDVPQIDKLGQLEPRGLLDQVVCCVRFRDKPTEQLPGECPLEALPCLGPLGLARFSQRTGHRHAQNCSRRVDQTRGALAGNVIQRLEDPRVLRAGALASKTQSASRRPIAN